MSSPSSTHSFHWKKYPLVARAFDLGPGFGASLNLSPNGWDSPIVIFFDNLEYCERLAKSINSQSSELVINTTEEIAA